MKKNLLPIFVLITIVAVFTYVQFKPVLQHPNSYLFSHGGDAVKSYYNFAYHLKYGEGFKHKGINYPYGEHAQFINIHPFHSLIFKQISKVVPINKFGVGILNLSMALALLLAAPFIFLILRRYKLPAWYSIFTALLILFLSPQLDRIKGHFEMVYLNFIPMFWYFLLKYRDGKKPVLWATLLVLTGLIGGSISAYFVAFYAIFLMSVLFADVWFERKNLKKYLKKGTILLVMAVIPLIAIKGLSGITDWANDRPYNPWGFYVFNANPFSIFLPNSSELRGLLSKWINISYQWEGRAYVGLPSTLLALSILGIAIFNLIKKKKDQFLYENKELNTFLFGATLVLLFSMCFPFKYGFGFLLELLPPVKQFRALGRFAWIFYYVFTVYAAYLFYQFYLKLKKKDLSIFATIFLVFVLSSWTVDAGLNMKKSYNGIFLKNDKLESSDIPYQHMLQEANINIDKYQAILFLPFANTSGDKLLFEEGMNAFADAMQCSYHTGLPLIQSFSPRLPFSNALSTIQLLADSTIQKTRLKDMTDQPLLVVIRDEKLSKEERWMKDHSKPLLTYGKVTLAEFELDTYKVSHNNWLNYVDSAKQNLTGITTIKADVELSQIFTMNFDQSVSENIFHGDGALFQRRNKVEIFKENFFEKGMSGNYELSFWLFFDTRMYDMPQPKLHIYNTEGKFIKTIRLNNRHIHNIYESWVRVDQQINIEEGMVYQLEISGKYITVDDLLLQPVGSNVLISTKNGDLFNNFPI